MDFLLESDKKTVAVLFGRMNPPTSGHEENVEGLKKLAAKHDADHLVVASHSHDAKKNPLSAAQKVKHLKRAFPNTNITTSTKEKPSIFHTLSDLHKKGYKHVIIAGGEDRAGEYNKLKDYNGKEGKHGYYNFKSIKSESTGERKAGVSGTDMRKHATNNDFSSFRKGLPSKLAANEKHAKEVFHDVRSGMGLNEIYDPHLKVSKYQWGEKKGTDKMKDMTPGEKNNKLKETFMKIPYLLMNAEQKRELQEQSGQLEFDGIQTRSMEQCPSAYKMFKKHIEDIRAGKHLGELTGHTPEKQAQVTPSSDTVRQVAAGIAMKPHTMRHMQFKQYVGL